MAIKKYSSGQWEEIPYRKYETATDTITSLPKTIIADGQNISSCTIKGNLSQSGTPTPTTPIYPTETGDKTANLFDVTIEQGTITINGDLASDNRIRTREYIDVDSGYITLSWDSEQRTEAIIMMYGANSGFIRSNGWAASSVTEQIESNVKKIRIIWRYTSQADITPNAVSNIMLVVGQTAKPYQPYGYKIPILSGNTTTNEYLGQVQSTRQIKQLVFTGQEDWSVASGSRFRITINDYNRTLQHEISVVSHYESGYAADDSSRITNGQARFLVSSSGNNYFYICDTNYSTTEQLKTYLSNQYANGTPVTVWYVLATPTTGILNEPIRKIGTYADSVSVTNIPTTGTAESFDVSTTLKPSEVDLTYHGWHEHSDTKYTI